MIKLKIVYIGCDTVLNETCESWYFDKGFLHLTKTKSLFHSSSVCTKIAYTTVNLFYVKDITDEKS